MRDPAPVERHDAGVRGNRTGGGRARRLVRAAVTVPTLAAVALLPLGVAYCYPLVYAAWHAGCHSGVSDGAIPAVAGVATVSARDYCGETDEQAWRVWLVLPVDGRSADGVRDAVVARLRAAGWTPIRSVPPVAARFVSLCDERYVATVSTYAAERRAEARQVFYASEPIEPGEVAVAVGVDPSTCRTERAAP